jgi:hypothetical protein
VARLDKNRNKVACGYRYDPYLSSPFNNGESEEVDGLLIAHAVATGHANKLATGYQQPSMWSVAAGYAQRMQPMGSGGILLLC